MSSAARLRIKRRQVLPGFPWLGQFATPQEAREYVSGEIVQCLICGKSYKALGSHINRIHELDETSYKQQFGIPYTVGLVSGPTAKRHAAVYAENISTAERLTHVASARESLRQLLDSGSSAWRQSVSSVYNQKIKRILAVNAASACNRTCHWCGNSVTVKGPRVFYKDEMIHCEECLAPTSRRPPFRMTSADRKKLREWAEDNPERAREYVKARNWWGWQRNPFPLISYAVKWGARLRIMPSLLEAAKEEQRQKPGHQFHAKLNNDPDARGEELMRDSVPSKLRL